MSQSLKAALALIFMAVLGWVLLQPVFDAVELPPAARDQTTDPSPSDGPSELSPDPSPEPTPNQEDPRLPDEFRRRPLSDRYPPVCLETVNPASPLIAVVTEGGRLRFGTPAGPSRPGPGGGTTPGRINRLHDFNGTGDLYAAGSATRAAIASPQGSQGADGESRLGSTRSVIWSPRGGCGVAIDSAGSLLVIPDDGAGRVVRDAVDHAAFSPDGRRLAVVLKEPQATSLWVAGLTGDRMQEVLREPPDASLKLRAWSPDGQTIYFTPFSGGLSFVTTSDPPQSGRLTTDAVEELEQCGDRLLAVSSGAILAVDTTGLDELTSRTEEYRHISCSPDGSFIAAIGAQGLVLLDGSGALLRDLTQDSGYTDVFVDWGRQGTGLIFGRVRTGGDPKAAELWFIPEGNSPRSTGITYRHGPNAVGWAASPPTGLP